jgi:hypothetical protein
MIMLQRGTSGLCILIVNKNDFRLIDTIVCRGFKKIIYFNLSILNFHNFKIDREKSDRSIKLLSITRIYWKNAPVTDKAVL